ncbi:MAG: ATP-binding protein [Phycisphaerales bacterium]|nr:MAG: ATP-binding protein [Phycisphaerales bacterium]
MNSGSRWHRWDPHIHTPGTVLEDVFGRDHEKFEGEDAWDRYLKLLENATPPIRALGITDYYVTDCYERVLKEKATGRLAGCDLIFPNIEMRYDKGTVDGRWINVHLLVSPEDPDHIEELNRFLSRLTLDALGDSFACTKDELTRLGKRVDKTIVDNGAALAKGCEQVKVVFKTLREEYSKSDWAKANIIVAVSGTRADGTSGMDRGAGATLREELEKFAHAIFASSPQQREFWLGCGAATVKHLHERYNGPKPCLHGCDAHELAKVGKPEANRYCWIKGDPAFDTLRQACIDPARAFVGDEPPSGAHPSQTIKSVKLSDAEWAKTPKIDLNPGLVAIIGARGSGKTALADAIALGCDAVTGQLTEASFLQRAKPLLGDSSTTLLWDEGESVTRRLDLSDVASSVDYPRARYLSQKFVEHLCSAREMTDSLLEEIERIVFEAHPPGDRDWAATFAELLETKATRHREARIREEQSLAEISERIGAELEKDRLLPQLEKQLGEKDRLIANYTKDRAKLVTKGSADRMDRFNALNAAAENVRGHLRSFARREQTLLTLQDEVANFRNDNAPEALSRVKERYKPAGFKDDEWQVFLLDYTGDVDGHLTKKLQDTQESARKWKGSDPVPNADPNLPFIADGTELAKQPLALLEAEIARVERLVSVDKNTAYKFAAVSKRINEETAAGDRLKEQIEDYKGAKDRAHALVEQRNDTYARVFGAIVSEEEVLRGLYRPLENRLAAGGATLKRLSFTVTRDVDVASWATMGEERLDLRHDGPFKGRGTLEAKAREALAPAWQNGNSDKVREAMEAFLTEHREQLLGHSPVPKTQQADYRAWAKTFAKWLYSTDHISIRYSINYDGVDIRKLSPGTRGIVLVLLYLALDDADDRPLIIDQPEENLDPESIYQELVGLFQEAKNRRQIILVTHNANLVVNADADQIIVASAGPHAQGGLPPISYVSGGLEENRIRDAVCRILEGGEPALQERARRLRVKLDR